MTDLRQAAQQALHELEGIPIYRKYGVRISNAITALRTTLEQQAESVDCWDIGEDNPDSLAKHSAFQATQEQQDEPVAWMDREGDLYKMPEIKNWAPPHTMLYTTSPQRQWVGLTDEDLEFWTGELGQGELGRGVIRAVADKLKERNT